LTLMKGFEAYECYLEWAVSDDGTKVAVLFSFDKFPLLLKSTEVPLLL